MVKTFAFSAAMSATVWAGVGDWYLPCFTNLFRWDTSMRILILSVPFLGVTTIGEHHSMVSLTGAMIPCSCESSSSTLSLSRKANGIVLGVLMQNGWASLVK